MSTTLADATATDRGGIRNPFNRILARPAAARG